MIECGDQLKCLVSARMYDPLHVSAEGVQKVDVDSWSRIASSSWSEFNR